MLTLMAVVLAADGGTVGISLSPSEVYARVSSSVFVVTTDTGRGSGVVVGPELVVTNFHVVRGATAVSVSYGDLQWPATVERASEKHDLALLRIAGLRRPVPSRRFVSSLRVGERVYALGAPLELEQTFTEGLVSALRPKDETPIQHSAAISNGSSGGGLFDDRGRLIGINTAARAIAPGQVSADLNFAVPTDWINELLSSKKGAPLPSGVGPPPSVVAPQFHVLRRPPAIDCHLVRRDRYAPNLEGELSQLVGTEQVDDHLFVNNFQREIAIVGHGKPPLDGIGTEVVMSAIDGAAGIVQFEPTRGVGPRLNFVFGDDGSLLVVFAQSAPVRGQPRDVVTVGECVPFDFARMAAEHEAQLKERLGWKGNEPPISDEDACNRGSGESCLALARDAMNSGATGVAALNFKKACLVGQREGCEGAHRLYTTVGNDRMAAEMRQRLCDLGGCK